MAGKGGKGVRQNDGRSKHPIRKCFHYKIPPRPRTVWIEVEEEPLAWYWKLWCYGGLALVYMGLSCYIMLTFWVMI